jgi:hypothetical protein
MENSLDNELKKDLQTNGKPTSLRPLRELTPQEKHRQNQVNKALNNYFPFLIIAVVAAVLILSYFFIIKPKYRKIVTTINTTFYEKNQLAPKYSELSGYKELLEAYNQLDPAAVAKAASLIPGEYLKEDLFTEMVYLASQQGLTMGSLVVVKDVDQAAAAEVGANNNTRRPGNAPAAPAAPSAPALNLPANVGSFNVKMTLNKVDYPALKKWLAAVENSLRLIDIRTLSFDPKTSSASLEMVTYYLKNN